MPTSNSPLKVLTWKLFISEYTAAIPACLFFPLPSACAVGGGGRELEDKGRWVPPAERRKEGKQSLLGGIEPLSKPKPPSPPFGLTMPLFVTPKKAMWRGGKHVGLEGTIPFSSSGWTTLQECYFRQVPWSLWDAVFSSIKWEESPLACFLPGLWWVWQGQRHVEISLCCLLEQMSSGQTWSPHDEQETKDVNGPNTSVEIMLSLLINL